MRAAHPRPSLRERMAAFWHPRALPSRVHRAASSSFAGADTGRLYSDWFAGNFSADFEIRSANRLLRARARSLVRDSAYFAGWVNELAANVVGPAGIRLKARVKLATTELHSPTNARIEAAWSDFGLPEHVSADHQDDWPSLQRLILKTIATDGECFIQTLPYFDNAHGFALRLIDADQVDETYTRLPSPGVNEIRMGVELDPYNAPVAYHVWTRHPADAGARQRIRILASEMVHLFVRYRVNQTRGVTWLAPVLTSSRMLDGYTEAELVAARMNAAQMGVIVTPDPANAGAMDPNEAPDQREIEASPGSFPELAPGQDLRLFNPQHPATAFKDFSQTILRGVARGLGASYMSFTGDLSTATYSSARIGMLAERDIYRTLQAWLAMKLCRPVYLGWVPMAQLTGALVLDQRLAADATQVTWKARGWSWVDPLKDIQARILGVQHGMDDRTSTLDDEGEDLEETFQNLAREQELADKYGISIIPPAGRLTTSTADKAIDEETAGTPEDPTGAPNAPRGAHLLRAVR